MNDKIKIEKTHPKAQTPFNKLGDAGHDLYAIESAIINPGERKLIRTGIKLEIPVGFYGRIAPRSGLALKHGIDVMAGVIDCFSESSSIKTLTGNKTAKDLTIKEKVFSVNEETLEVEIDEISEIVDTGMQETIIFETEEGNLEVTQNSIVYTNNGPKRAKEITKEDFLLKF